MFGYVFKIHVMGDEYNDQKPFYHSGIIYADTYAEVMEKLASYYREDDIIQISKLFTANACMNLVEKLCKIYNKLEFNCNLVAVVD